MKRFLLPSVGVLAMASLAHAADLPRQMVTKAPVYAAAPQWMGAYIGGHGGYGVVIGAQPLTGFMLFTFFIFVFLLVLILLYVYQARLLEAVTE